MNVQVYGAVAAVMGDRMHHASGNGDANVRSNR